MYPKDKVAFIDTETTGLHPEFCDIWEIAIIVDDSEHLFHPEIHKSAHIDEWVREHTRFSEYGNLDDKQPPWVVMEKVADLLGGRHLVGACPWFDSERLARMWRTYTAGGNVLENHNTPWHYHMIDVENLMIGYIAGRNYSTGNKDFPVGIPWKHAELEEKTGTNRQAEGTKHTAMGDARQVKHVFECFFGH